MKKINVKKIFFSIIVYFLISTLVVKAGSCTVIMNGDSSVEIGKSLTITVAISSITDVEGGIGSIEGTINLNNDNFTIQSLNSLAPFNIEFANRKYAGFSSSQNTIKSYSNIYSIVLKAEKIGSSTLSISNSDYGDSNGVTVNCNNPSKTITVKPPASSNNNLSSITVDGYSLTPLFNKDTLNYNLSVNSDITAVKINAMVEDSTAKIGGTGTKNLSYGNNDIKLVVTAENGDKKTYTITINRKDNRSSDNYLKSLKVKDYELNKNFNSNDLNYEIEVPYAVKSVDVEALAKDSKSKVSISGNTNLKSGTKNKVSIVVTAENGGKRTYVLTVLREKDPSIKKSDNNYLENIIIDKGNLVPEFDKTIQEYIVDLEEDINSITIEGILSDEVYGKLQINGPNTLKKGINKYTLTVTAEDGSERKYIVDVNKKDERVSDDLDSIKLKAIILENGKLTKDFNRNITMYNYKSKGNLIIREAIPEVETSTVKILEKKNNVYIIVISITGEIGLYHLIKDNVNITVVIISIILFLGLIIYLLYRIINNKINQKGGEKNEPEK